MIRNIFAVIAGFVVATAVMVAMESANTRVFYPELAKLAELKDKEALQQAMASAPVGAMLVVALGWVLGGLAGGFVAAWIGRRSPIVLGMVLGGLLTLAGIANNLMLPPPIWFWIVTLVAFLPAAYLGARLAPSRTVARA